MEKIILIYFQGKHITCICTRNSVLIRREASFSLSIPRGPHKESISSIKIMDGASSRAERKRFETCFSPSPIHLDTMFDAETVCIDSTHVIVLATFHLFWMITEQTHLHLWEFCTWVVIMHPKITNWKK